MRQFYLIIGKGATLWHQLSWSHYCELLPLKDINKEETKVNDFVKNPIVIHNKYNLDKKRTYRSNTNIYELYR